MEQINVQILIEEIRAEIAHKHLVPNDLNFDDVQCVGGAVQGYRPKALQGALQSVGEGAAVNCRETITGNAVAVFIKKALRKLMLFFVEPIVAQQNAFNSAVAQALNQMDARAQESEIRTAVLQKQTAALQPETTEKRGR